MEKVEKQRYPIKQTGSYASGMRGRIPNSHIHTQTRMYIEYYIQSVHANIIVISTAHHNHYSTWEIFLA